MTKDEAIKMAKARLECLERSTSGLWENCNNDCENCNLNYDQGNMGEQKEWLKFAIKAMEQGPVYFPPCVDCNTKMNEIREAYDKLKNQEPCKDAISRAEAIEICKSRGHDNSAHYISELPSVTPTRTEYEVIEDFINWCKGNYGLNEETGEMYESEFGEEWELKQVFEEYESERRQGE